MSSEPHYNLRPIWDALLDIYEEIRKVCDKHGIRFWATGGTALGAMRHKGFIPWDDDLDLIMMKEDYEMFWRVAVKDLPPYLKWHSWETDPNHHLAFGKVCETRQSVVETAQKQSQMSLSEGLFIDIYPIVGQPGSSFGLLAFKAVRGFIARVIGRFPLGHNTYWRLYCGFLGCIPRWMTRRVGVAHCDGKQQIRSCWEKKWFETTTWLPFDRTTMPVAGDGEAFVERQFHNWRELPPPEKRVPAHQ